MAARLHETTSLAGFLAACLVDSDTGLLLAAEGDHLDPDGLAAMCAQVVQTEQHVMESLGLDDMLEEILVTLGAQIHLLHPLNCAPGVVLHLVLDRARVNLGLVRVWMRGFELGA